MKKIVFLLILGILGVCYFGCRSKIVVDDTPKDFNSLEIEKLQQFAQVLDQSQYVLIRLSRDEVDYSLKYFEHFVKFLELAKITGVVFEFKDIDDFILTKKKNQNFLELANLLNYQGISLFFSINGNLLLQKVTTNFGVNDENKLIEELDRKLEIVNKFLESFDNGSEINAFIVDLNLPNKNISNKNLNRNSLLSVYKNNSHGTYQDNLKIYRTSLNQLAFLRKLFALEQIIWSVNIDDSYAGLLAIIFNNRLELDVFRDVDHLNLQLNSIQNSSNVRKFLLKSDIKKSLIVELILNQNDNWEELINSLTIISDKKSKNESFAGVIIDDYTNFYNIWRVFK